MATGSLPFQGETAVAVLNAIVYKTHGSLRDSAKWLPLSIASIVDKALEKDCEVRYQTAADLRADLKRAKRELDSAKILLSSQTDGRPVVSDWPPARYPLRARWERLVFVSASLVVLAMLAYRYRLSLHEFFSSDRWEETASFLPLTDQQGPEYFPSLSPDGKTLSYASKIEGNWDIMVKRVGGRIPMNLTKECVEDDTQPSFSPDGELIAFRSERNSPDI